MQLVELTSVDGTPLRGAVHRPQAQPSLGTVLLLHGITVDMDEGGMFVRLADRLAAAGWTVLRVSFRGHGRSGGTPRGVTIAGEMLDLQTAVDYATVQLSGPLSIVASSFGAVPTSLSLPWMADRLDRVVLWNPVLDLRRTFVEPELPWGKENYSSEQQKLLTTQGFLLVDGAFELGRVLFEEFRRYHPFEEFVASSVPSLVVHGDRDSAVSYDIARQAAAAKPSCAFHTVVGSDHGFDSREREDEAITVTVNWLTGNGGGGE